MTLLAASLTIVVMNGKELCRYAERRGWQFARRGTRSSHFLYWHTNYDYLVSIPVHGTKRVPRGLLETLIKQIDGTWKGPHS